MSNNILPMKAPQAQSMLDAALRYAEAGIKIFATTADGKAPAISNRAWSRKLGREIRKGQGGLHLATTDPDLIDWMFSWRNPPAASGCPAARPTTSSSPTSTSTRKPPAETPTSASTNSRTRSRPPTACAPATAACTPTFAWRAGHGKHELGENIEVQTDGAYVLLPPSKGYRVEHLVFAEDWDPPPWDPVGLGGRRAHRHGLARCRVPTSSALRDAIYADAGNWHNSMVRLTAHLVGIGWTDAQILQFVPEWTASGHTHAETFHQVATAVAGARAKWDRKR
jgi:hypothetical protein